MKDIKITIWGFLTMLFMVSCSSVVENDGADKHEGHEEHKAQVSLSAEQQSVLRLRVGSVKLKKLREVVYANGNLELPPNDKADVSSLVGGVIKNVKVIEGSVVKKGQVLAILEHPEVIQMQQDYLSHVNELLFLEKEKARQETLYNEKVGSGRSLQKVTSDYRSTLANVEGLKAKLRMLGLSPKRIEEGVIYPSIAIKSPINGKVSLVETNIGAFVQPQDKLFEVVNNEDLHVALKVYEKDVSKVSIGQQIIFQVRNNGVSLEGEVFAISPAFEDNPKAVHIHAHIRSENTQLISGMYVKGRIVVGETDKVKTLPEDAIVTDGNKSYVFMIKNAKGHSHDAYSHDSEHKHKHKGGEELQFARTEVILGQAEDGNVEVKFLKKIDREALFAINAAYYL
jgi:cobalt-zinc-cadmium efflux system membrane fusion protein